MSSAQLAAETGTDERYLREWLASQAAGGYVTYDEKTEKFGLSEEQAFTLANGRQSRISARAPSNWPWARLRRSHASRNPSAPALAWVGMNMWTASFTGVRSSFVPVMPPTW